MKTAYRPDIAVIKHDGAVAVVEVKARGHTSLEWAGTIRLALLGDSASPHFFILAARDQVYLWTKRETSAKPVVFDTHKLLGPFLARAGASADAASEETLGLAVSEWLLKFTLDPPRGGDGFTYEQARLMELAEGVRDGQIVREPILR